MNQWLLFETSRLRVNLLYQVLDNSLRWPRDSLFFSLAVFIFGIYFLQRCKSPFLCVENNFSKKVARVRCVRSLTILIACEHICFITNNYKKYAVFICSDTNGKCACVLFMNLIFIRWFQQTEFQHCSVGETLCKWNNVFDSFTVSLRYSYKDVFNQ